MKITKNKILFFGCLFIGLQLTAQTPSKNYIVTTIPNIGVVNISQLTSTNSNATIQYLDGLGRPIQSVQRGIGPGVEKKDFITYTEYDGAGRDSIQWLPIPKSGNNGAFVALSTFKTEAANLYGSSEKPYVTIKYENSPLNRVTEQFGAGNDWYLNNKRNRTSYEANDGNIAYFYVNTSNSLVREGNYPTGTLYKTVSFDEDNKSVTEYKDKLGQVIMKRSDTNVDTYFVYNDLGQLCYVLPPLAADASGSADAVNKYGYVYRYDTRGNCIYRKLPGCEPVTMTYYPDDLLMTSQDGNQLAKNEWLYYEYDALRRLTKTSLVTSSSDVVLTENYYDNYNFIGSLTALNFATKDGYDGQHPSAKGLMTGTRVRILDNTNSYLITANYYDYKGQLVQSRSTNHLGGYDFVYNAYDFTEHVTKNFKAHSSQNTAGQTTVNELYDYRYDHAGRLDTTIYTLNDKAPVVLAANTYDDLGRLIVKLRHNRVDREEFEYNIRNWITHIMSGTNAFEENLYYTQSVSPTANGCYNGNIAQITWKYNTSTGNYKYSYDELNRLTSAILFSNGVPGPQYYELFTYDKMGNIKTLMRYGSSASSLLDNLTMTYNGNQVTRIDDPRGSRNSYATKEYNNQANTNNEMAYDLNGNLTKDLDRNIYTIKYNILNLPEIVQFKDGHQIINAYDASGKKLSSRYYTILMRSQVPVVNTLQPGQVLSLQYEMDYIGETGTFYLGNIEYGFNGCDPGWYWIDKIYNPEGYVNDLGIYNGPYYQYYRKDHLGNNREVWLANNNTTVQRTQYYPSGLPWASNTGDNPDLQNKKYNGKEFVEMHGYDTYDYGARGYYAAIDRWTSVDPLAEKYYSISPYAYCAGNPVRFIDPDGRFIGTTIGTIVGGIAGGINAYRNHKDVWAGVAEGAVSGMITGAAVDGAIAFTVATGGTGLLVVGAAAAAGTIGGAIGGVAGDVAGQTVTEVNKGASLTEINISTDNFTSKAISGAIGGTVNGVTGGTVSALGKLATASTKALQTTMSENITTTAATLTAQGASGATVNTAVNGITRGMGAAGSNTVNGIMKVDAAVSTITAVGTAAASNLQTTNTPTVQSQSQNNQNNTRNRPVWQLY